MPKLIVSYRRSDSAAQAGRIYDHLLAHFGEGSVFMDVDAIPFGTDFRSHIKTELLHSDVLLAVIGPHWFGVGPDGRRRIDDEADPVRVEVETVLRQGTTIVPILIDGATMPGASDLPEVLKDLAFLNAAPVDMGRDFRAHMDRLSRALDTILAGKASADTAIGEAAVQALPPTVSPPRTRPLAAGLAALVGVALVTAGWFAWNPSSARTSPPPPSSDVVTLPQPTPSAAPHSPDASAVAAAPIAQPAPLSTIEAAASTQRSKAHGTFAWYELWTVNTPAAQAFYRSVVGWDGRTTGVGDAAYTILLAGQSPVAGLATLPAATVAQGARPNWVGYVNVTDVDASTAEVKQLGGTVYRAPADVAGIGRYALVADPQGAAIVLFRGLSDAPPVNAGMVQTGHAAWRELQATDRDAAFAFYAKIFGWTKSEPRDVTTAGQELFGTGGEPLGAIKAKPASLPAAAWTYFFQVDGLNAAVARVRAGGGTIVDPPVQTAGGRWVVQGLDPQGAAFSLSSAKP